MAQNFPAYLSRAIRAQMENQGITEKALHEATLIPRSTLYRRFRGIDRDWRSTEIQAIATALNLTELQLVTQAQDLADGDAAA